MRFHPNYPNDNNKGQRHLWNELKRAFERDEGVAYYRYPIFASSGRGRSEPDFVMIHRQYGIWVLECKGCYIGHIADIEGHEWIMTEGWYSETMSPVSQVEAQFYEVKTLVERYKTLRSLRLPFEYRVVLPFVSSNEWSSKEYSKHPSTEGVVWLKDDIEPARFRQHVRNATKGYMPDLPDRDWGLLLGAFRGLVSEEAPRSVEPNSAVSSPSRAIHAVERKLKILDEKQDRVAQEVPEGPQRIRGLAGTGKTVLFARRIAQMHAAHPEWDIAFVYWSRSLKQQITELVENVYRRMVGDSPDFTKLRIWHAWGSKSLTGFCREVAGEWGVKFCTLDQAKKAIEGDETPFSAAVRLLEAQNGGGEPFLDALVIDEGQDLPGVFYRVAHRALREPKRLYWAYDEAQGIDSLVVPSGAEVFGRNDDGSPNVNLSGTYQSGIPKAHNMNRCYRTPRLILTAAHAINMGLHRKNGPLQGVTQKEDWAALGYRVLEGDFSPASVKAGNRVVVEREKTCCGHPVDRPNFDASIDTDTILKLFPVESDLEVVELVVHEIQRDLEAGLRPEDVAVVCLDPISVLSGINDRLKQLGIQTFQLTNQNQDEFRREGHVTLSGIRRAKGNEAYKIYALNLHLPDEKEQKNDAEAELVARNQVFTALTRTKVWCVAVGRPGSIFRELQSVKDNDGRLIFAAFNQASLRRSMEDLDLEQMPLFDA